MSFSTHFALSNLGNVAEDDAGGGAAFEAAPKIGAAVEGIVVIAVAVVDWEGAGEVSSLAVEGEEGAAEEVGAAAAGPVAFAGAEGEEKNDVMEASPLGFLADEEAISAALRLRGAAIVEVCE